MKRIILWCSGALVTLVLAIFVWQDRLTFAALKVALKPGDAFSESVQHPVPDYTQPDTWAAHPDTTDPADEVPSGLPKADGSKPVAAFFVHGTTFISKKSWNSALDDPEAAQARDNLILRGQVSAFNLCCDVFVPKYRQATFWSFMEQSPSSHEALNLAYEDIERAFDHFLSEISGRPFILAGHSQGARHLLHLLEARADGATIDQLVAAYLVGIGISPDRTEVSLPNIPVCETPDQTGCFASWNAMSAEAKPRHTKPGDICVNPLSWSVSTQEVSRDNNLGALSVRGEPQFVQGFTSAGCADDRLRVGPFANAMFDGIKPSLGKGIHHLLDYALFYGNIRDNALVRSKAAVGGEQQARATLD